MSAREDPATEPRQTLKSPDLPEASSIAPAIDTGHLGNGSDLDTPKESPSEGNPLQIEPPFKVIAYTAKPYERHLRSLFDYSERLRASEPTRSRWR